MWRVHYHKYFLLDKAKTCLQNLNNLCGHGHFSLAAHLNTVREMLASIGQAHSAWNMAALLQRDGVNARYVDLTAWDSDKHVSLDDRIATAFSDINLAIELPIVTGYAHNPALKKLKKFEPFEKLIATAH